MAELDPSIILGVKSLNLVQPDPLERHAKLLGVQSAMGTLQEQERTRAEDEKVRQAYQQSGGDPATLRKLLTGAGAYKSLQALDKFELEKQEKQSTITKNTAQAGKANWEVDVQKLQHGAALLAEAKDPQSWETVLRIGELNGTFKPEVVAQWRAQGYSPQLVQSLQAAGITRAQQLTEQGNAATRAETGRHNVATEGNQAGTLAETGRHNLVTEEAAATAALPATVQAHAASTATGRAAGEAQATAQVNLPKTIQTADRAVRLIDEMVGSADGKVKPHPGFKTAVGASGISGGFGAAGFIPGTATSDFKARFEELQGGAFLQAFESLKGGGQITEIEGAKATAALTRMKLSQSEGEFVTAAREFQDSIKKMVEIHKARAAGGAAATGGAPTPTGAGQISATGTGTTLRVPPEQQAQRNDAAAVIRARESGKNIDSDIASLEAELKRPSTVGDARKILSDHLALLKRGKELLRGEAAGNASRGVNPANLSDAELRRELGL